MSVEFVYFFLSIYKKTSLIYNLDEIWKCNFFLLKKYTFFKDHNLEEKILLVIYLTALKIDYFWLLYESGYLR